MHVDSWTTLTLDEVRSRSKLRPRLVNAYPLVQVTDW